MQVLVADCTAYKTSLLYAAALFRPAQVGGRSPRFCACNKNNTRDKTNKAKQWHLAVDGSPAAAAVAMRSWQIGRMPAQLGRQGGCSSLTRLPPVPALSSPLTPPLTHPAWPGLVPMMHHHLCREVACLSVAQMHSCLFVLVPFPCHSLAQRIDRFCMLPNMYPSLLGQYGLAYAVRWQQLAGCPRAVSLCGM